MLGRLVAQWRYRVARLRRVAIGICSQNESVESEEAWLCAIRIRILTFLLRRYGGLAGSGLPERTAGRPRAVRRETFCVVAGPVYHGPREVAKMRSLLDHVQAANRRCVRRWRLFSAGKGNIPM